MPDIAPEFQGQARRFRAAVKAVEAAWSGDIAKVTRAALVTRAEASQHGMRPKQFAAIEDKWRAIDPAYRLSFEVARNARRLIVSDVRLATMVHRCTDWVTPGDEDALILVRYSLNLTNGRHAQADTVVLASVGAHALGQWWRRSLPAPTDATLIAALGVLAAAADELIARGGRIALDTPHGQWLGDVARVSYNACPPMDVACIRTCI